MFEWQDIIASTDGRRALLQNLPWAASLSKKEVDALAFASKPCIYSPGDVLVRQGERPQFLHLIVSGLVTVSHDAGPGSRPQLMCTSTAGDVVGERELVTSTFAFATATAAGDKSVFCLLLDASDYETLAPSRKELALQRGWPMSQSGTEVNEYSLVDLKVKAVVGSGAFAQVALVRHAKSARVFALKRMNRAHLEVQKVVKQVLNERFILGDFHHPCIARLVSTFKSKVSLYMLLEPCMGGELFTRMRVLRRLEEPHACFYAACVVSAFDYMQSRAVIYRDLKPENIMIHSDGYVRVVDFGFAKRVFTRTYTVCGTPEYLAPELLMMKGHGHGVDWWALGVLLYEMVVGVAPFCFNPQTRKPDPDLPPPELYKNILNPKYELPFPSRLSSEICELIEQLLAWDPLTRLGCLTDGANGIKRLGFFAKIDWQKLYTQRIPPPYKPPLKSDDDFSNFEQHDTLSAEQFLAEQPYDLQNAWDADW
jgi:cGMP-dependent protein kinase